MKNLVPGDKPTIARLAGRLKRAQSHSEYQRIQCVLIRATLGSSAAIRWTFTRQDADRKLARHYVAQLT